ncbi:hypothetical protein ACEUZ9_000471 [Paracoccus litorisediminis]|uniref:hypothetical protein n=1 Tax=Paracoccus litorisediminis TaxID=2006130 RepID=UPI00372F8134
MSAIRRIPLDYFGFRGRAVKEAGRSISMIAQYFLKNEDGEEKEVGLEEFCRAERLAGFWPKVSSDHPDFMRIPATAGF